MEPPLAPSSFEMKRSPAESKAMAGVLFKVTRVFACPAVTALPKMVPLVVGHTLTFPLNSLS